MSDHRIFNLFVIKSDGTAHAAGKNPSAEAILGVGDTVDKSSLTAIGAATNWTKITCGTTHAGGIRDDGTLWLWGTNGYGEGAAGATNAYSNIPLQEDSLGTSWAELALGNRRTFGIKTDGTLWCCGYATGSALTSEYATNQVSFVQIGSATDWSFITSNNAASTAIKTDGSLWTWGTGIAQDLLVDAVTTVQTTPVQVDAGPWATVFMGTSNTIGIKEDGSLWGWGANVDSCLTSDLTTPTAVTPTQIGTSFNWAQAWVSGNENAGYQNITLLNSLGEIWVCGVSGTSSSDGGALGTGTYAPLTALTQMGTDTDWADCVSAAYCNYAIKTDGSLYGWGVAYYGELAQGVAGGQSGVPMAIDSGNTYSTLSGVELVVASVSGDTADMAASLELPVMTLSSVLSNPTLGADVQLPALRATANLIINYKQGITLPALGVTSTLIQGGAAVASVTLPAISASARFIRGSKITCSLKLPALSLRGAIISGETLSAAADLPAITCEGRMFSTLLLSCTCTLPRLNVRAYKVNGADEVLMRYQQ